MRSTTRIGGLLVAAALAVGACSGGGGGERPDQGGFAREAELSSNGTLRIGVAGLASLDPAMANSASSSQMLMADLLYDGLTAFDPRTHAPVASIADSWTVSGDGLTWTFHLNSRAEFSDGTSITATDVKTSLERVAALGVKSLPGLRLSIVEGYSDTSSSVSGFVAQNASTFVVKLTTPYAALPELLADPVFGIVDNASALTGGFAALPIGSGPFVVDSRTDSTIVTRRGPRSKARLAQIELRSYPDVASAYAALRAGEVDMAPLPTGEASTAAAEGMQVLSTPHQVSVFYGMNLASRALQSPELRHAILKAVDRDAIRAKYFDGHADVMTGVIGPGVAEQRDNGCGSACAYDPAAAKALVAAAFGGGAVPTVHVDYFVEESGREAGTAQMIVGYLQAAGIPAEARPHSFDDYQRVPTSGQAELFRFGWIGAYPSADAYLTSLFTTDGADNVFALRDQQLDALLASARSNVDPSTRTTSYLAAEDRVFALAPVLPIVQYRVQWAAAARVHGVELASNGSFDVNGVTVGSS